MGLSRLPQLSCTLLLHRSNYFKAASPIQSSSIQFKSNSSPIQDILLCLLIVLINSINQVLRAFFYSTFPGCLSQRLATQSTNTTVKMYPYRPPRKPTEESGGVSSEYMAKVLGIKRVRPAYPIIQPTKKRGSNRDEDDDEAGIEPKKTPKKKVKGEEQRLRRFRQKAPITFNERLVRVRTQRMFMLERNRTTSADGTHEEERFDVAGSTGNVYQVLISKVPSCSCPDASKGNQCKHIIYVHFPFPHFSRKYSNTTSGNGQHPQSP